MVGLSVLNFKQTEQKAPHFYHRLVEQHLQYLERVFV